MTSVPITFQIKPRRKGKANRAQKVLTPKGNIPRASRLMALALHFESLRLCGLVTDYADMARLGDVTRARMTQIMSLINLAPDIQEEDPDGQIDLLSWLASSLDGASSPWKFLRPMLMSR